MAARIDIARYTDADVAVSHCLLPAWEAGDYVSISNPSSIAVSFTHQHRATVELDGARRVERTIPAGSFGTAGAAPIAWLRVREPSECLEVTASAALRASIADDLGARAHRDLGDLFARHDPVVWGLAARLRSLVRSGEPVDALQIELLARRLYERLILEQFGGRRAVRGDGGLSPRRLARVVEWIEAHLARDVTVAQLARVASLSSAHFIRSFGRTVGMSPYQYLRMRRLHRARELLAAGAQVAAAAHAVGFASVSQFRTVFRRAFGHAPIETPRRGASRWISKEEKAI